MEYKDSRGEVAHYTAGDAFATGFRLVTKLVMEAFFEDDGFSQTLKSEKFIFLNHKEKEVRLIFQPEIYDNENGSLQ